MSAKQLIADWRRNIEAYSETGTEYWTMQLKEAVDLCESLVLEREHLASALSAALNHAFLNGNVMERRQQAEAAFWAALKFDGKTSELKRLLDSKKGSI